jgi:hypothetical protein
VNVAAWRRQLLDNLRDAFCRRSPQRLVKRGLSCAHVLEGVPHLAQVPGQGLDLLLAATQVAAWRGQLLDRGLDVFDRGYRRRAVFL